MRGQPLPWLKTYSIVDCNRQSAGCPQGLRLLRAFSPVIIPWQGCPQWSPHHSIASPPSTRLHELALGISMPSCQKTVLIEFKLCRKKNKQKYISYTVCSVSANRQSSFASSCGKPMHSKQTASCEPTTTARLILLQWNSSPMKASYRILLANANLNWLVQIGGLALATLLSILKSTLLFGLTLTFLIYCVSFSFFSRLAPDVIPAHSFAFSCPFFAISLHVLPSSTSYLTSSFLSRASLLFQSCPLLASG